MAHLMKFKLKDYSNVLRHDARELERYSTKSNINHSMSSSNWVIEDKGISYLQELMKNNEIRNSTTVVLGSWIIDKPKEINLTTEEEKKFFQICYDFTAKRYGKENMIQAVVHRDETTDHIHIKFAPIYKNKFNAKKVLNKTDLLNFHKDLNKYLDKKMDRHIPLTNERTLKQLGKKSLSPNQLKEMEYEINKRANNAVFYLKDTISNLEIENEKLKFDNKKLEQGLKNSLWLNDQLGSCINEILAKNEKIFIPKKDKEFLNEFNQFNKELKKKDNELQK